MTTQYSYQPVGTNYQDVEANKPPPYSSTYMYGNQQQPTAPPQPNYGAPPENYGVESQPFANDGDDDGISAFSDKSVRQGKQFMFICCFFFIELHMSKTNFVLLHMSKTSFVVKRKLYSDVISLQDFGKVGIYISVYCV